MGEVIRLTRGYWKGNYSDPANPDFIPARAILPPATIITSPAQFPVSLAHCPFRSILLLLEPGFRMTPKEGELDLPFFRVIPLFTSEAVYEKRHGLQALLDKLDEAGVPMHLVQDREPAV